jgi:hypothetical protein
MGSAGPAFAVNVISTFRATSMIMRADASSRGTMVCSLMYSLAHSGN